MLKAILHAVTGRFERRYDYDASYMRELIDIDPAAFFAFSKVQGLSSYRRAPPEALVAAGLVGTLAEDCGPCTQIGVDMAAKGGVEPQVLRAILAGDEAAMGEDAALAWKFARASLARDLEAVEPLREEVVRRWGDQGLVALSLTLMTARMYPTLKYALGYGKTCSKIVVAGKDAPVAQLALAA